MNKPEANPKFDSKLFEENFKTLKNLWIKITEMGQPATDDFWEDCAKARKLVFDLETQFCDRRLSFKERIKYKQHYNEVSDIAVKLKTPYE